MQPTPGRPWVIAHRGASQVERENTAAAFRRAAALGADAVELDARRTADGAAVVHHDPEAAGLGPIVAAALPEIRTGAPWIPTLEEALDACAGMWVNVEVKNNPGDPDWDPEDRIVAPVLEAVRRAGFETRVLLSSFNPLTVGRARPGFATGWLTETPITPAAAIPEAAAAGFTALHPAAADLAGDAGPAAISAAHEAGLLVICWTLDDPDEMRRLAAAGIDGIITNRPDAARSALD